MILLCSWAVLLEALVLLVDPTDIGLDVGEVLVRAFSTAINASNTVVDETNDVTGLAFGSGDGSARITVADSVAKGLVTCTELIIAQEGAAVLLAVSLASDRDIDLVENFGVDWIYIVAIANLDDSVSSSRESAISLGVGSSRSVDICERGRCGLVVQEDQANVVFVRTVVLWMLHKLGPVERLALADVDAAVNEASVDWIRQAVGGSHNSLRVDKETSAFLELVPKLHNEWNLILAGRAATDDALFKDGRGSC